MRKCAPGGSECVLNFKPVTLIDASGLDEAQVTRFCFLLRVIDPYVGETIRGSVVLFSFWFGVCVVSFFSLLWFHRFVCGISLSHPVSLPPYVRCTCGFVTDGNCPKARR